MKTLYLIGGTMGTGKSTVGQVLKRKLDRAVYLDGDWCWDADPFQVTDETKAMVLENIIFLLKGFLRCSAYENVIFCWVMHEQRIADAILRGLEGNECAVKSVSLLCSPEALRERLLSDVKRGLRDEAVIGKSMARLPLYRELNTLKLDVSALSPDETAERIAALPANGAIRGVGR